jgi:hypothetical protein
MGKHKQTECKICFKPMRSNNVKGHMKVHYKYKVNIELQSNEEMCRELVLDLVDKSLGKVDKTTATQTYLNDVEQTGMKRKYEELNEESSDIDTEALRKEALKKTQQYQEKIKLGEELYKILGEGEVEEEAFSSNWKEALNIYVKQKSRINYDSIKLKSWQEELLRHIGNPSDRKIIWVQGAKCGEGKTFFQEYVESLLGIKRVVAGMNIKVNTASLCHALQKRPLSTTDIFMFNIGKSRNKYEEVNYELLEQIKDGRVFASKYNSQELKFKTPNTVVVFSNNAPDVKELARDRWNIFSIESDELVDRYISESYPLVVLSSNKDKRNRLNKKKKACNSDNDTDSE